MLLAPDSEVSWGDPAVGSNGRRLDDYQRDSTDRPAAQVNEVPVAGQPLLCDVLAHGGHYDSIAERYSPNLERAQQVGLGNIPVVIGPRHATVTWHRRDLVMGSIGLWLIHGWVS